MKKAMMILVAAAALQVAAAAPADPRAVVSRVSDVTVYNDRARVVRKASRQMAAGETALLFDGLPLQLDQNSIQVAGTGNAVLKDVVIKRDHKPTYTDAEMRTLTDRRERYARKQVDLDDKIAHARGEKAFVERIATNITGTKTGDAPPELNPQKWIQMVTFYRQKFDALDAEIRKAERDKDAVQETLAVVNRQIQDLGGRGQKAYTSVIVTLDVPKAGTINLELAYVVYGPGWEPLYDIRVDTEKKTLDLAYNARVRQATGEDWNGVALKLSTAQPNIGGNQPELSPWHIDFYQPPLRAARRRSYGAPSSMAKRAAPAAAMEMDMMEEEAVFEEPLQQNAAVVEARATSVVFAVGGTSDVPSDNAPHKVAVMTKTFEPSFMYSAVPKLAGYAYLRAAAKNETEYPLLPGPAGIFLDNNFVCTSQLKHVAPGESFKTDLGVDKGMDVERRLVKRFRAKEGVITKRERMIYEYLVTVTNNKKAEQKIVIQDQVPLSNNEEIRVDLVEPRVTKETKEPELDNRGFLTWKRVLQPGEKLELPLTFTVEYPKGRRVSGID